MSDIKYEALWTALKAMLEKSVTAGDNTEKMLSGAFLDIMNNYEESYEKIQEETK